MNLRDRLRLLKAAGAGRPPRPESGPASDAPVAETTLESGAPGTPDRRPALLGGALAGYITDTESGPAFYVETRYPIEHCRGPLPLEHLFGVPGSGWERLARVPATVAMREAVFFDTETTGLAGGTGTYAFLVGLGFFEGPDFVVRQYFLRDYGDETALLEAVARDLQRFSVLITFNGKAFDWPLMETRYRLARRAVPLRGVPHIDLLHPARRLFKERLGPCNLTNLEAHVLGVPRFGDVAGHLIPQLYFDYLRTGLLAPLADVVLHNRLDIVSLVSLAGWMGQMVGAPLSPTPDGELLCGDDLFAVGRLLEDRGLLAEGLSCYETARERGMVAVSEARALRQLAQAYKRAREHQRAVTIWERMIEAPGGLSLLPYVEMAKYHEHVSRDYSAAQAMAEQALMIAERRRSLAGVYGPGAFKEWQAVQHRLARLRRKLQA